MPERSSQNHGDAAGSSNAGNRRRREGEGDAIGVCRRAAAADWPGCPRAAPALLLRISQGLSETKKKPALVLCTCVSKREVGDRDHALDARSLQQGGGDLLLRPHRCAAPRLRPAAAARGTCSPDLPWGGSRRADCCRGRQRARRRPAGPAWRTPICGSDVGSVDEAIRGAAKEFVEADRSHAAAGLASLLCLWA